MSGQHSRSLVRVAIAGVVAAALALVGVTPAWAADPVPIASVQGTGAEATGLGSTVTVEGVITAYYAAPSNYRGYYLQTAGSGGSGEDATPGASDGIFVFFGNSDPGRAIGDLVRVTGTVAEFQGQSQISATTHELVESAQPLPEPVPLPDDVVGGDREQFEGMLVAPTGTYSLISTHQAYNFGTLWLGAGGMQTQSTEVADGGSADQQAIAAANAARRLLLDDGYSIQVTNNAHVGEQPYLTRDTVVRTGDTFVPSAAPYVLGFGFNDWRLQPQVPITDASPADYKPTWTSANPRPESAPEVGGDATFASFNTLNFFTTLATSGNEARGARTAEQFATQLSKLVSAINGLDADVVALQELENDVEFGQPVDTTISALVDALNADAGVGTWDFVPTPAELASPGANDVITTGIIFKPAAVEPVGESFADADPVWADARVPIGQTFEVGSRVVTVIANHFKSKSPPEDDPNAPQPADGQGFFNAERVAQAERLIALTAEIAADPEKSADVLLLGDFNSYSEEDPIQAFGAAGFVDLGTELAPDQETYTFDGQLGSLDHSLASASLADAVTGYGAWSINSPEWGDRGYAFGATEAGTPFRSSDHDPVVIGVSGDALPVTVDLLTINDFHGRLESAPPVAGAALLGGMVDWYEARNPNTIFAAAGDLIGASTFTSFIQEDQPTIDALNEIGLDVSAFGNHEFDQGREDVDGRITDEADWIYLASNLYDRESGEPAYPGYEVIETGGVSIGFVGAVTEELESLVSPDGIASLEVMPIVPEINRVADDLSDGDPDNGEADVVILLIHEGAAAATLESVTDTSTAFGRIVTEANANIDGIVSGHTHLQFDVDAPIPGTDRTRPVIMSGEYGIAYGHTSIVVDPETGELISIDSEVLPLIRTTDPFTPDPVVAEIVADAVAVAQELGSVSLGEITTDITRAVQSNGTTENRGGESTIGNLIADAQLAATQDLGTDLALMNPGGIRADLLYAAGAGANDPAGNVTYQEAALVQPFANTLVTLDLTGAQVRQLLEEQWQPAGSSRPFLKLGVSEGFSYVYDPAAPAGSRVGAMYLDGELVTEEQTLRVVANSFLAAGGDNFVTFREGENRADSGRIDLTAFVDYIGENTPVEPDLAQRAVGVQLSAPAAAEGYAPGEQVTATLSSLLFSKAGPTTGDAAVLLDGETLGSAPVTFAITDASDEQGTATVTFTIPEGVSGEQTLTVTGPGGTAVSVPITVQEPVVVEPVDTSIVAWPDRFLVKKKSSVDIQVWVRADDGSAPVGTVTLIDGRKPLGTVELTAEDGGRIEIPTGKLNRGIHLLTVRFTGADGFESSRTLTLVIAY
jgi:5'-nucleotidase